MKGWIKIVGGIVALAVLAAVVLVAWAWNEPMTLVVWASRRALDRAGLEARTIDAPSGPLHVWTGGTGPPLVFLHGAGDQAGGWARVAPRFTDRYTVIVPDLPGHGDSAPSEGPLPMTTLLDGVDALLDGTTDGTPAILVGNSLGAWIACLIAVDRPDDLARVVAVNGGPLRWENTEVTLLPQDREQARALMSALRDPGAPPLPDNVLDDLVEWSAEGPIPRLFSAYGDLEDHLLDGRMGEVAVPVDVVWGASDRLIPIDYARRMTSELPAARLTPIPDCGHAPAMECPDAFADALEGLLDRPPPGLEATEDP